MFNELVVRNHLQDRFYDDPARACMAMTKTQLEETWRATEGWLNLSGKTWHIWAQPRPGRPDLCVTLRHVPQPEPLPWRPPPRKKASGWDAHYQKKSAAVGSQA